ncbi:NADPH-dependent FMN reductase [Streptomyces boncukensis]|uniref:NAD(P)H-dependent oxidoreductase n=1 Tax=Streptomyces boncukensis TaxID=2711219 RepID=A0A6G4X2A5_9ACTN|nr:NAD(P)H-dependent oxidoreductase [Streptomyces boncukensis]NGO71518.1 NAD(P)H-dependent oxidoreductase [Streptomyces boncukensis]
MSPPSGPSRHAEQGEQAEHAGQDEWDEQEGWDGAPLRVAVIVGSTRQGREGDCVADWFAGLARESEDLTVDVVDLADFHFPERYPTAPTPQMTRFQERVESAEAFVIVTPEYNRSFPASLKQAIDFAYDEWQAKPVGFVSYGSRSVGRHAVDHLRTVFTELHTVTVRDSVGLDLLAPPDREHSARSAEAMLRQLIWWGRALRGARAARPYCI